MAQVATRGVVITADQVDSRRSADLVPTALEAIERAWTPSTARGERAFARTAGDEIQGMLASAEAATTIVELLVRQGNWRIGIGIGAVEQPVPDDVRAARGEAFIAARAAVESARTAAQPLCVLCPADPGGAETVDAALQMLAVLWRRRSDAGWEAIDARAGAPSAKAAAEELGISASALSQRLSNAHAEESAAGKRLAVRLLDLLLDSDAVSARG